MGRSELVGISVGAKIRDSGLALLFEFDDGANIWIPKSLIDDSWDNGDGTTTVMIPEWFAEKEELI